MKFFQILKYILVIVAIGLFFVDWRIAVGVLVAASILHTVPLGPNVLLNTITGYLIIGGVASFFYDWRLAIGLIVVGFLVAKFHVWGNRKNAEFYAPMLDKLPATVSQDFIDIVNTEVDRFVEQELIEDQYHRSVLQTEGMALVFWFLQYDTTLPYPIQEEIFRNNVFYYFLLLESGGLSEKERKNVKAEFESTYKTYNKLAKKDDLSVVESMFVKTVRDTTKSDLDIETLPTTILKKSKEKLDEYAKIKP